MSSRVSSTWRRDIYTVAETATVLHVSVPTVYRMIRHGILQPSIEKLGTGRRGMVIPREEIEHYIESLKASARRLTDAS